MWAGVRIGSLCAVLAATAACGSSSSSPTSPALVVVECSEMPATSAITAGPHTATGIAVNVLNDSPAGAASFFVGSTLVGTGSANGTFTVGFPSAGLNRTTINAAGYLSRQTGVLAPATNARVSLVPCSFNVAAFNQMFRHTQGAGGAMLARWTARPHLVIERRVLQFTDVGASSYVALTDTLTDAEAASLTTDLTDGYAILTDGRLGTFASVTQQTTATGGSVAVSNDGRIVVTRVEGLAEKTTFWGYARWSTTPDGAVTRGFVMIDAGFESSTSPALTQYRRSLRMHELGHALGCQHVSDITSVMNADARNEPTTFDRSAARLAMLRPVGNRAPDIDPTGHTALSISRTTTASTWHGAH